MSLTLDIGLRGLALGVDVEVLAGAGETGGQLLRLKVSYGNAMIAAHGHGAPETVAVFKRAHAAAPPDVDLLRAMALVLRSLPAARLSIFYSRYFPARLTSTF
jgi:hypothetical protein